MKSLCKLMLATALAIGTMPMLGAAEAATPAAPAADVEAKLKDARERLEAAAREVAELSSQMGRGFNMRLGIEPGGTPPRGVLGVGVGMGDKDGAHVLNVSPGGAAAEAGIKAGDIITSIGGEDITKDSSPGRALVEKMRQIDPNLKVQVGVLRDGKKMTFDVTPRPAPEMFVGRPGGPMGPGRMTGPGARVFEFEGPAAGERSRRVEILTGPGGPGQVRRFELLRNEDGGTRFHGMEFATLSERLGGYFGVKSGVLVVRAGANSPFKLQDGDVILSIDGREASSAQHAGRILRSYRSGEKLTVKVQRDRKAQTIEATAPAQNGRED